MADEDREPDTDTPESAADDAAGEAPEHSAAEEDGGDQPPEEAAGPDEGDAVYEIPVEISAVLGSAQIPVAQLLKMGRGAVLELDRRVGDPIDILVNKQMVAKGDVVVVEDRLGVTLLESLKPERLK